MLMLEALWLTAPAEPLPKCQTCQQDAMSPADQLSFPQIPPSDPESMPRGAQVSPGKLVQDPDLWNLCNSIEWLF